MAYSSWQNKVSGYWVSGSLPGSSDRPIVDGASYSYSVTGNFPLDYRTLRQDLPQIFKIITGYPGLKVYTLTENSTAAQEYVFLSDTFSSVVEYHPELAHFKVYGSASLPQSVTSFLGNGKVEYPAESGTFYSTIPDGTEGTIKLNDGSFYKYVWDAEQEQWTEFANQGSGAGSSIETVRVVSDSVLNFNSATDNFRSINDLTTEAITSKYKAAHNITEDNVIISSGIEADIVFTDNANGFEYNRKYVYLNGGWRIVQGVQEYLVTIPAYDAWVRGSVISSDYADIEIKMTDVTGMVDVIISHQFNSQYIDAFIFQESLTDSDLDYDDVVDEHGDRILASILCFKSKKDGKYKVKTTLPISDSFATKYSITLQK